MRFGTVAITALVSTVSVFAQTNCTLPTTFPTAANLPTINTLPNPWEWFNGTKITKADWACRRQELLTIVEQYFYGEFPDPAKENVTATRSGNSLSIRVESGGKSGTFSASITLPSGNGPFPALVVVGTTSTQTWTRAGIAVVTFGANAVASDSNAKTGAYWSVYQGTDSGAFMQWGWGASKVLDAIKLAVPQIDATKVGVTGCSRYGKAALAAGIFDERFAITVPQSAGMQGMAPFRYQYGGNEELHHAVVGGPWWTRTSVSQFANNVIKLPFDAHTFSILVAPRALISDMGRGDQQSNPEGATSVTFPAARAVYSWLGVPDMIAVAVRTTGHCDPGGDTNVLPFVQKILQGTATTRDFSSISPYTDKPQTRPWASSPPE